MKPTDILKVIATVICDDIRKEDNGKEILIGVYSGDIVPHEMPALLALRLWIQLKSYQPGDVKVKFRLKSESGTKLAKFKAKLTVNDIEQFASLPFPPFGMEVSAADAIIVTWSVDNEHWEPLITKRIRPGTKASSPTV